MMQGPLTQAVRHAQRLRPAVAADPTRTDRLAPACGGWADGRGAKLDRCTFSEGGSAWFSRGLVLG